MASGPRLLDSSVWLEILGHGPLEAKCRQELTDADPLFVPSVVIFEVYRKLARTVGEDSALSAIGFLSRYTILDFGRSTALTAADLSIEFKLGLADSIVLAHAREAGAQFVTLDNDLSDVSGVKVLR